MKKYLTNNQKAGVVALGFLIPWVIWKDIDIPVIVIALTVALITILL
ncbi:MAG TPA: hypothetical protein VLF41_03230 [Candidatus Nanoarchaeia archaeon]|nr:hypothetical protein [Candidatus Nanoarchaeia archaeon]